MSIKDKIICIVEGILAVFNLMCEFIPSLSIVRQPALVIFAIYSLVCLVYFGVKKK